MYITGDTHGDFSELIEFAIYNKLTKEDIVIILGDAGIQYFGDERDESKKKLLSMVSCTFLCIHGNHEMRPWHNNSNRKVEWCGGEVYMDLLYPNILYAVDGSIFSIQDKTFAVLGGAYSIDKEYRLAYGYRWFEDEQPSEDIKKYCEKQLEAADWKVDYVLSHTCPIKFEPTEVFLKGLDQSKVDKNTENWLSTIEEKLTYKRWYFGHFHTNKDADKYTILFHDIRTL